MLEALGVMAGALLGGLGLNSLLRTATHEPVMEDPDELGYFKGSLDDKLPACPDTIPENIMELR